MAKNRYIQILEVVFKKHHRKSTDHVAFERSDLVEAAEELGIRLPKNLGDLLYSFRYRSDLPESITQHAPESRQWIIRPAGRSRYEFVLVSNVQIAPSPVLAETKIPDATPGVIASYALNDEQALLAKIRYNRLVDIFTGLTCYSLQSHLRTTVAGMGQVETDEIYVGLDRRGAHYILTVQAKGRKDRIGIVQIEQDAALCRAKFPNLIARTIAAQLMDSNLIAILEIDMTPEGPRVSSEKHYRLVHPEELSAQELETYCKRSLD